MWHKAYIQQLGLADSQARAPLLLLPAPPHLAPTVAGAAIRPRDRCLVGAHLPVAARAEQAATRLRRPPSLPAPRALRAPTPPRVAAAGLHSPTHPSTQTTGSTACAPPSRRARPKPTRPPARCPPARPLFPRASKTPDVQPPTAPPQTFLENVAAVASDKSKADLEAHLRSVQN